MKKPNKLTESIGKTISAVEHSFDCSQFLVAFTDGTFSVLAVDVEWDGIASIVESYEWVVSAFTDESIMRAGVATHEELRDERDQRNSMARAEAERRDRDLYERLKRKFEA